MKLALATLACVPATIQNNHHTHVDKRRLQRKQCIEWLNVDTKSSNHWLHSHCLKRKQSLCIIQSQLSHFHRVQSTPWASQLPAYTVFLRFLPQIVSRLPLLLPLVKTQDCLQQMNSEAVESNIYTGVDATDQRIEWLLRWFGEHIVVLSRMNPNEKSNLSRRGESSLEKCLNRDLVSKKEWKCQQTLHTLPNAFT